MIGIDVGGANTKIVDEKGAHIHYCPLWKGLDVTEILKEYRGMNAAVVMSGELADNFFNKAEGIAYIVHTIQQVFPDALFYGVDGKFHTTPCSELASANWIASADFLRQIYQEGILIDIGSTTTDIIPFAKFDDLRRMTDIVRLQRGYLLYTGLLRTPIATLANSAVIDGIITPFSTEYFACSGDAHYTLGHIIDTEYTTATPDGKKVSREACLRRLARTVCADLEEIGEAGAVAIAQAFWDAQKTLVCDAVTKTTVENASKNILVGGVGSALFAPLIGGSDLTSEIGLPADALPAFSVKKLAEAPR